MHNISSTLEDETLGSMSHCHNDIHLYPYLTFNLSDISGFFFFPLNTYLFKKTV